MTEGAPSPIEQELAALAAALVLPPTPELRDAVRARLAQPVVVGRSTRSGRLRLPGAAVPIGRSIRDPLPRSGGRDRALVRWAVAVVLAVAALLAFTSPGQAAVARLWHFAGVVFRDSAAPAGTPSGGTAATTDAGSPSAPASGRRTGSRPDPSLGALPGQTVTDLASARRQARFPLHVPETLGDPDVVLIGDGGSIVSLIYRPGPGRPDPDPSGISARIDEFASSEPMFEKSVAQGSVESVVVNGAPGIWVSAPHAVLYLDRYGSFSTAAPHLAGRTLIWQLGGVTIRLEGAFTREQALTIARGLH